MKDIVEKLESELKSVEELVIPNLGASFRGDDLRDWLRPCVYLFLKDEEPLYVGLGRSGITRPFQPWHHQSKARQLCTEMRVWFCASESDAEVFEKLLIEKLQPRFNKSFLVGFRQRQAQQRLGEISRCVGEAIGNFIECGINADAVDWDKGVVHFRKSQMCGSIGDAVKKGVEAGLKSSRDRQEAQILRRSLKKANKK